MTIAQELWTFDDIKCPQRLAGESNTSQPSANKCDSEGDAAGIWKAESTRVIGFDQYLAHHFIRQRPERHGVRERLYECLAGIQMSPGFGIIECGGIAEKNAVVGRGRRSLIPTSHGENGRQLTQVADGRPDEKVCAFGKLGQVTRERSDRR